MTPQGSGRFCSDCKKVVTDFTKAQNLNAHMPQGGCGNFYAHQLSRPFNDRRDNLILFYQKTTLKSNGNKVIKKLSIFLLFILLVGTGCARKVRGVRGKFSSIKDPKKAEQEQPAVKTARV